MRNLITNVLFPYNDIHLLSPAVYPVGEIAPGPNRICIGDIFDLRDCAIDQIDSAKSAYNKMKALFGDDWIDGNHELGSQTNDLIFATGEKGKVVCAHGDFESWGADKAKAFRSQSPGASNFKRSVIIPAIHAYETTIGRTVTKAHAQRCVDLAKANGCTTYIGGHLHPKETFDQMCGDVRVVILKRGFNQVNI